MATLYKTDWSATVKRFRNWWLGELAASIPAPVARFFSADTSELLIRMEPRVARLELRADRESHLLAVVDLVGDSDDKLAAVRASALTTLPTDVKVTVFLPADKLLHHRVLLPQATEANLGSVLRFELDRLTPFTPDSASFGYRVTERYPEHDKIQVELFVVRQDELDHLLGRLKLLGLAPHGVYPPTAADASLTRAAHTLNMLPAEQRPPRESVYSGKVRSLAVTAGLLLLAVLIYPSWQLSHTRGNLQQAIDGIRKEASQVGARQAMLANRLGAQDALSNRRNKVPGKLVIVHELTRLLPNNTWVSRLSVNDSNVILMGESRKASDLIELLEQSDYFQNVNFGSSITRNPATNMERYEIRMELTSP